jgi:hypothetical protein
MPLIMPSQEFEVCATGAFHAKRMSPMRPSEVATNGKPAQAVTSRCVGPAVVVDRIGDLIDHVRESRDLIAGEGRIRRPCVTSVVGSAATRATADRRIAAW